MIELRILERKVPRPRGIDDGFLKPPPQDFIYVDVPQYRRGEYRIDGATLSEYVRTPDWAEWHGTDWIDVPRVREE